MMILRRRRKHRLYYEQSSPLRCMKTHKDDRVARKECMKMDEQEMVDDKEGTYGEGLYNMLDGWKRDVAVAWSAILGVDIDEGKVNLLEKVSGHILDRHIFDNVEDAMSYVAKDEEDDAKVWSTGGDTEVYHTSEDCRSLKLPVNAKKHMLVMSESEAIDNGLRLCGFCKRSN